MQLRLRFRLLQLLRRRMLRRMWDNLLRRMRRRMRDGLHIVVQLQLLQPVLRLYRRVLRLVRRVLRLRLRKRLPELLRRVYIRVLRLFGQQLGDKVRQLLRRLRCHLRLRLYHRLHRMLQLLRVLRSVREGLLQRLPGRVRHRLLLHMQRHLLRQLFRGGLWIGKPIEAKPGTHMKLGPKHKEETTVKKIIIDKETVENIEALQYEVESRKDVIAQILTSGAKIAGDTFREYQEEYRAQFIRYNRAKQQMLDACGIGAGKAWSLDFASRELTVED